MVGYAQSAKGLDRTTEKNLQSELGAYARARAGGIQPDGTTRPKIEFAERMSEKFGGRYGEDFRVMPNEKRNGYDAVFKKDEQKLMSELKSMDHEVVRETAKKTGVDL
jgi:hypothetical protein